MFGLKIVLSSITIQLRNCFYKVSVCCNKSGYALHNCSCSLSFVFLQSALWQLHSLYQSESSRVGFSASSFSFHYLLVSFQWLFTSPFFSFFFFALPSILLISSCQWRVLEDSPYARLDQSIWPSIFRKRWPSMSAHTVAHVALAALQYQRKCNHVYVSRRLVETPPPPLPPRTMSEWNLQIGHELFQLISSILNRSWINYKTCKNSLCRTSNRT
jgi:hypothetical protein